MPATYALPADAPADLDAAVAWYFQVTHLMMERVLASPDVVGMLADFKNEAELHAHLEDLLRRRTERAIRECPTGLVLYYREGAAAAAAIIAAARGRAP
jgi:hypothetical protein